MLDPRAIRLRHLDPALKATILSRLLAGEQVAIVSGNGAILGTITHEVDAQRGRWRLRAEPVAPMLG